MLTRWPNRAARRNVRRAPQPTSPSPRRPRPARRSWSPRSRQPPRHAGAGGPPGDQTASKPPSKPAAQRQVSPTVVVGAGLSALWLLLGVTGVLSTFGLALFLIALSWAAVALFIAGQALWDPTDALPQRSSSHRARRRRRPPGHVRSGYRRTVRRREAHRADDRRPRARRALGGRRSHERERSLTSAPAFIGRSSRWSSSGCSRRSSA